MAEVGGEHNRKSADPLIGTVLFGEFSIIDLLGSGGMARVYKAMQRSLNRYVAIKTLTSLEPETVARFINEIKTLGKLEHQNIVQAIDCMTDQQTGRFFFVMEYLPGMTLEDLIRSEQKVSTEDVLSIVGQLCDALAHAHQHGIIHRDLKPANIILLERDGKVIVKVVDFGIARVEEDAQRLTKAGVVVGSPFYMSPEQCQGMEIDARADLYALGALMYELITGQVPYNEPHIMKVMSAHCDPGRYPDPVELKSSLKNPQQLNQIIHMAMETEPEDRFQNALQFKAALQFWYTSVKMGTNAPIPANNELPAVADKQGITTTESRSLQQLVANQQAARDPSQKVWRSPTLFNARGEGDARNSGVQLEQFKHTEQLVGKTLQKYKFLSLIGEGGMAIVYRAENIETSEIVAIKTLKFSDAELAARFAREVSIHDHLKHPNIVRGIECLETPGGQAYFVMEFLNGVVLEDHIAAHQYIRDVTDICTIFGQLLDGIEYAHDKGIVHRDIKPENIILTEQKGQLRVKVLDFGVARIQEDLQRLTKTGVVLGSPAYMSPEQCTGGTLDARSDLYSLGVVAYEMITGRLPIGGQTEIEVMDRHCNPSMVPEPLSTYRKDLPAVHQISNIFSKCLEKDPRKRYQSVVELKMDLHDWWKAASDGTSESGTPFRVSRRKQELKKTAAAAQQQEKKEPKDYSNELANLVSKKGETDREAYASRFKGERLPGTGIGGMLKPLALVLCVVAVFGVLYFAINAFDQYTKSQKELETLRAKEPKIETPPSAQPTSPETPEVTQEASNQSAEAPPRRKKKGIRVLGTGEYNNR